MRSKGVWIAFATGVAAGVAVALLYAPQPGARTRRQLKDGMDDVRGYLEEAAECLKEQADNLSGKALKLFGPTGPRMDEVMDRAAGFVGSAVRGAQTLM